MTTSCYFDPACVAHDPGPGHSERSERLLEIVKTLKGDDFDRLKWPAVSPGKRENIALVHAPDYVDLVFASVPATGYCEIEIDEVVTEHGEGEVTTLSPQSGQAILYAVGAVTGAVDDVMTGRTTNAFCAIRPPGHHALPAKAMGFCVFGNVSIGARYAQKKYHAQRIAIVDFDVHHGNGTQEIFARDASVSFCSIHQLPLWPETGHAEETGVGNVLNVPILPNSTRDEWMKHWQQTVLPWLERQDFELLFISAGFDAHVDDPKGAQFLETEDYYRLIINLMAIAKKKCAGRVIAVLEGGYDVAAGASSAAAMVSAMMTAG
jgi:acetoin utilization deacetylase AcuC-like enzyme